MEDQEGGGKGINNKNTKKDKKVENKHYFFILFHISVFN